MKFNTSFLRKFAEIVTKEYGMEADIIISIVSELRMKKELLKAQKAEEFKIYHYSGCFLLVEGHADEDIFCFINKDVQQGSIFLYTEEQIAKNKIIRAKNKEYFK